MTTTADLGPTPVPDRGPSPEQLTQIRLLSSVIWGHPLEAYGRYGRPSTRADASDLIRTLDEKRGATVYGTDIAVMKEEAVADTKTCSNCGTEKSTENYYDGHNQCKQCLKDKQKARDARKKAKKQKGSTGKETSEGGERTDRSSTEQTSPGKSSPPSDDKIPEGDGEQQLPPRSSPSGYEVWRDRFRDPRLSDLEALRQAVVATVDVLESVPSLESVAELSKAIAELP